jgi:formylglycine-generating enzyme required for sulfatase activity
MGSPSPTPAAAARRCRGAPGEPCGACADGTWACQGASLVCQGAALANACGGCGELEADPGDPCGPCEDGVWMCQERALTCQGAARICPDERAWVSIEPGAFTFGSSPDEPGRGEPERAATPLTIERRFLLQATEVTQAQWEEVMEDNPSTRSNCPGCPVENLSFFAALEYLNRLSRAEERAPCYVCGQISDGAELPCADLDGIEGRYVRFAGLDCEGYRLPTEAEWEYAARAGTTTPWPCGDDAACLPATAWFGESSRNRAQPVAQLEPNAWGLYDMQGNVAERVWGALEDDPASATYVWQQAHQGMLRGGDFYGDADACRSAALTLLNPNGWSARWQSWGLRAARTLPAE